MIASKYNSIRELFYKKLENLPADKLKYFKDEKHNEELFYLYFTDVKKTYIFYKYSLIKADNKIDYRKKLNRLYAIDDFNDEELLTQILDECFTMTDLIISLDHAGWEYHHLFWDEKKLRRAKISETPLDERDYYINKIVVVKNELIKSGAKADITSVAKKLGKARSTFVDKLKDLKIDFDNLY